jgi:uroporphyrinogen-III synthase
MRGVIVIRPEPGCGATVATARAMGLEAEGFPLFAVRPLGWDLPVEACDALLIGSANALRHGGPKLARLSHLPVYAVGEATAEAAQVAGFALAARGTGGLQDLLGRLAPAHRRLLRLAGQDRVSLEAPTGVSIVERVVYASEPLAMPSELARRMDGEGVVLLHSAAAARHFAAECDRHHLARGSIALAAIGPRVCEAAGAGWRAVETAPEPTDAALLALAAGLCQ